MPPNLTGRQHERVGEIISPHIGTYELGNSALPIALHRAEIERAIRDNPITILVAPTGSGKTTQVPQYALEMGTFDDIIVTQPRIVAARTVSERVRSEIDQAGRYDTVGYYTSKESTDAPQSEQDIAFLTDGKAAMQMLYEVKKGPADKKRILILDEVHEWSLNIELLLALVSERTDPASPNYDPNLKVVIMSATMDSKGLQAYFNHVEPPIIEVDVPTFPVEWLELEDPISKVSQRNAQRSLKVLAFLPGKAEISSLRERIKRSNPNVRTIPLHGRMAAEQQRRAFETNKGGVVIATTEIAQTSVTIDGAEVVVDTGLRRTPRIKYNIDPNGTQGLFLEHISQADMAQRAGRTGRTGPGTYILAAVDRHMTFEPPDKIGLLSYKDRPKYHDAEMYRGRLDDIVLRLRTHNLLMEDLNFFHKPPSEAVAASENRLRKLGAIDHYGEITDRGRIMSRLPLDVEHACMIAFAYENRYSNAVKSHLVNIVSIMQQGGILSHNPKEQAWRDLLATDERGNTAETQSDFLAQLEAYITLTSEIEPKEWADYDVDVHAVETVARDREALVELLGFKYEDLKAVSNEDRDTILTCINAGQLNQIWRPGRDGWRLHLGNGTEFDQSKSSVVRSVGKLATGQLFSLGTNPDNPRDAYHTVTRLNEVPSLASLAVSARHLVEEVPVRHSERRDHHTGQVMIEVIVSLGGLTLDRKLRVADKIPGGYDSRKLEALYRNNQLASWKEATEFKPVKYNDIEELKQAIEEPQSFVFGKHHITGEPLRVWRGGKGKLCRDKKTAIHSLKARKQHLEGQEEKKARKIEKTDLRKAAAERRKKERSNM